MEKEEGELREPEGIDSEEPRAVGLPGAGVSKGGVRRLPYENTEKVSFWPGKMRPNGMI